MPRSAFLRRRSATIATPEDEHFEEEEQDGEDWASATAENKRNSASGGSALTREVLNKNLTGAQARKLQRPPHHQERHKRYSSLDVSALSPRADDTFDSTDPIATTPSSPSATSSYTESIPNPSKEGQPPFGKLKKASSRIWGNRISGTSDDRPDYKPQLDDSPSAVVRTRSPSFSAPNGSQIVQGAQHAVAQELFPKRLVQGWFSNLHPSSAESSNSPQSSSPSLSQRISSPLRNMSNSPRVMSPPQPQSTSTASSSSTPNRLFDRKWVDKAANYLFDTDANVDKCPDDIWLLGVCHPGYQEPTLEPAGHTTVLPDSSSNHRSKSPLKRRSKKSKSRDLAAPSDRSASLSPTLSRDTNASTSASSLAPSDSLTPTASGTLPRRSLSTQDISLPTLAETSGWPPSFYLDFCSRIQLTYRSGFAPIVVPMDAVAHSTPSVGNGTSPSGGLKDLMGSIANSLGRRGDADGLTSDAGWGCMLRTGQSLLANALAKHHLGRDWRKPLSRNGPSNASGHAYLGTGSQNLYPPDYARYARLVTWFLDDPAPTSPFSVHRFALVGKKLGKEVGQWFGPSTAAGAIKTLCQDFPAAQMGVAAAVDATVYLPEIVAASESWTKPVLILLNLRLGLSGVNPIYYPAIKSVFTFPQSVGIAGGRPSSSYYFVGSQADSLFYIDPHYSKPAAPIPGFGQDPELLELALQQPLSPETEKYKSEDDWEQVKVSDPREVATTLSAAPITTPPPMVEITSDDSMVSEEDSWVDTHQDVPDSQHRKETSVSSSVSSPPVHTLSPKTSRSAASTSASSTSTPHGPLEEFLSQTYHPSDLASFHPERVRKMAISGLDPSMLVGFLVRSQDELDDWVRRSEALKPSLYSIQRQVPGWVKRSSPEAKQPGTHTDGSSLSTDDAKRSDSWDISDSEEDLGVPDESSVASHSFGPRKTGSEQRQKIDSDEEDYEDAALNQSSQTIAV